MTTTAERRWSLTDLLDRLAGPREAPATGQALSWRLLLPIFGFLTVWRLAILLVSHAWGRLGVRYDWVPPEIGSMWLWRYSVRWDAGWYLGIAEHGYEYIPGQVSSVAFFPLFPLLIRIVDTVLPGGAVLAGLVVVHLALAAASVYVFQTIRLDFGEVVAWRSLVFLLLFPTAFFYSAIYTESLFLLSLAGALYHARRGQWTRSGLFGFMASATKIVGVLIPLPLALELWRQRGFSRRNPWPLAVVALSAAGAPLYFAYLWWRFGDALAFFHVESSWHRDTFAPVLFLGVERLLGDESALLYYPATSTPLRSIFLLLDTTILWVFLAAGVWLWWKVRPSYGALVIAMALVPALSGSPQSMNRYVAVLFPAFILLGRIEREGIRQVIALASTFGLVITAYLFVQAYWAG